MRISSADAAARPLPSLRARDLVAGYDAAPIIHGLSVEVGAGEVAVVLGPNGSGKSTLMKAILGGLTVHSGRVELSGEDVTGFSGDERIRRGLGYVPQVDDVFAPMTVKENLEVGAYILPRRLVAGRIDEVLSALPLLARMLGRRAGMLSGGERKLLAIGRALMLAPPVLLLDEPTANLAPQVAQDILGIQVPRMAASGKAILLVEQRVKLALACADRAYILGGGLCVAEGTPAQLASDEDFATTFLGG